MRIIVLPVGRCRFLEEKRPVCGFQGTKYGGLRNVPPYNRPSSRTQRAFQPSLIFYKLKKEPTTSWSTSGQKLCIEIIYIELQASVSSQKKNNTKCRKQNSKTTWKYCRSYCWNEIDDEILPVFAQFLQSWKYTFSSSHHLYPRLNASIFYLLLHIWQGYLTFSYYFIFDRIVCVLVNFY